jgi:hypothetical protein
MLQNGAVLWPVIAPGWKCPALVKDATFTSD